MYDGPVRGGNRGGQGDFRWSDVKDDKHRENYLGHTVNAPAGRWQKNKDVHWYTRDKDDGADAEAARRKEEIRLIKQQEEDALAVALGFAPNKRDENSETTGANSIPVKGEIERLEREEKKKEKELRREERALKRAAREIRRDEKRSRQEDRDRHIRDDRHSREAKDGRDGRDANRLSQRREIDIVRDSRRHSSDRHHSDRYTSDHGRYDHRGGEYTTSRHKSRSPDIHSERRSPASHAKGDSERGSGGGKGGRDWIHDHDDM